MKIIKIFFSKIIVHYKFFTNRTLLKGKRIWWRDDDSFDLNDKFLNLLKFKKNNKMLNVYLSVIPGKLKNDFIRKVNEIEKLYVLPHGYLHKNYSNSDTYLNEYPDNRDAVEISEEMYNVLRIMRTSFPDKFLPIFVPPWEHFSDKIIPILKKNKINFVSMSGDKNVGGKLKCVNCDINFHGYINYREGQYQVIHKSLITLCNEIISIIKASKNNNLIGFMTHHMDMNDEDWSNYEFILKMLHNYGCEPSNHKYFMEMID